MKKEKGLNIVEVSISFSIALVSIIALYLIVYSGSKVSYINNYYIDANNLMNFIANEIQNNPALYIKLNNQNETFEVIQDSAEKLKGKLNLYKYSINGEDNYNIYLKIIPQSLTNIVQLSITLEFYYKNRKKSKIVRNLFFSRYQITHVTELNIPDDSDI